VGRIVTGQPHIVVPMKYGLTATYYLRRTVPAPPADTTDDLPPWEQLDVDHPDIEESRR
jgi:hypothetical protein